MITIELNGEQRTVPAHHNVQALIDALSLTNHALAVAINREVVPRASWQHRHFNDGDKVDLVRAIGGG